MRRLILLILPFFLYSNVHKYGDAKTSNHPIARIQIYGERCTGTNFLESLVRNNIKHIDNNFSHYGAKHFPCWFDYPFDANHYQLPEYLHTLAGSDDCLFIVIFRDPYDWLRSFHKKPYHSTKNLHKISFSEFIRTPWTVRTNFLKQLALLESNPATGLPFENAMKLRTARNQNLLRIKDLAANVYYITYETLAKSPKKVLKEIATLFRLKMKSEFTPVLDHLTGLKSKPGKFEGSHYAAISRKDLAFINAELDWNLENTIGYTLLTAVPEK